MPIILSRLVPALFCGLFFYVGYLMLFTHHVPESPIKSLDSWQKADAPYGIPINSSRSAAIQRFDPRMHLHSPFENALIPRSPRFDAPMGTEHAGMTYNAQSFMESNRLRGGKHTGDDINGIGGQNSDFGDPVYAIANGLVVYTGTPSKGWGKTIIVAHRLPNLRILHSMYSHLNSINVALSSYVARGSQIGNVGNAEGRYLAHLHFEIRETDGFSPQSGYAKHPFDRLNPEKTLTEYRNSEDRFLNISALEILQSNKYNNENLPEMDVESAIEFQKYLERTQK